MTPILYIKSAVKKIGILKTYLIAVSAVTAFASICVTCWYCATFLRLTAAYKDVNNAVLDILKICEYICKSVSLVALTIFFLTDYKKKVSAKFEFSLIFLFVQSSFTVAHYLFNTVWNKIEHSLSKSVSEVISTRILFFAVFLISLFCLFRQSRTDFASTFKKSVSMILLIISIGGTIYYEENLVYERLNISDLIFSELYGFIVYSPYLIYILFGKKVYRRITKKHRRVLREPNMTNGSDSGDDAFYELNAELEALERAYRKGEISKMKYKRMKEDIIDKL